MTLPHRSQFLLCVCTLTFALLAEIAALSPRASDGGQENGGSNEKSLQAFRAVASVLTSPRCLNCHIPGDSPLQGDDNHPHPMNVKRGSDGRGSPSLRCSACHQTENARFLHGPPGRPDWRLPPPSMPLVWKGLSIGGICRAVKDPATNGGMTTAQLIEHVREDPFVNWAWNPGLGRTVPPLSHEEFVSRFKEWIDTGATCPE